jgi:WXG100 family type VII secretion target
MPILHMQTEIAHSTQQTIIKQNQEIRSDLHIMNLALDELRANWQGNSAAQFFQEFEQWRNGMNFMLDELINMGSRLQTEIIDWEETSARFE